LTQLSIDTLRAWEKRYAAVRPVRKNGIRFYSEADIERLSLLRQAVAHGHSIGDVSGLSNPALKSLAQPRTERTRTAAAERPIETIMTAIEGFQYAAADRELRHLASLMTPRELIHNVALPLLQMVGEQWHDQRLRIAQEHMITQLLSNLLAGMTRIYAPERPPATVLTATLSDDLHGFGILAASILAAGAGLGVIHLGPNLPVKEIVYATKRSGADVVLLSLTNPHDRTLREEQLRRVRSGLPAAVELWIAINPPAANIIVKGARVLTAFEDLERELRRIGGRF
jgi:DNA-binding transcriptional MerR regulator